MKILCIADQIDPQVYSSSIKTRFHDADMVLSAGDLPLDYLDFIVSSLNCPLFFVFGNHHLDSYGACREKPGGELWDEKRPAGITHIGSAVTEEGGLIIAGLGGSMMYNGGNNQYTEFSMKLEILKLLPRLILNRIFRGRWLDILITHAPPGGIHDKDDPCHRGFKCFLSFMKLFKPRYLIHGHIHIYDVSEVRITEFERTTVINAYGRYLLNTEER